MSEPLRDNERLTRVLSEVTGGRTEDAAELLPLVYEELRRIAGEQLARGGPGHTLQATALVHEAWVRVVGDSDPGWDCRAHFFGAAARAMRNILVEQYRRKTAAKRDGKRVELEAAGEAEITAQGSPENFLILDEALTRLEAEDELKAKIVMLRFFTGLTMKEVAATLGLPLTRVEREWRFTRAWLSREVEGPGST